MIFISAAHSFLSLKTSGSGEENDLRAVKPMPVITSNHDRSKELDELISIPCNYLQLAQSAEKIAPTSCDWVLLLIGWKTGARFLSHLASQSQSQ